MDDIKKKINKLKLEVFDVYINKYKYFSKCQENKESKLIKQNKEKKINSNDSTNYNKSIKNSKFNYYEKQKIKLLKTIEYLILIFFINAIILNINGILCESYIVVKINKSGKYKILFNGGIVDVMNPCHNIKTMHTPSSMKINGNVINPPTNEYLFTGQQNTIKLYYDDNKNNYACLFCGCSDIDEIDASNLITSNVENMEYMFHQCSSLTSLIISNFNTEKVKYMRSMFGYCSSLTSIDVSHFHTPLVEDMAYMFEGCSKLSSIYLLNFDTSNVLYMDRLFHGCSSLTTLNISNFRTPKVEWMSEMFRDCSLLTTLDLSNFDFSKVNNIESIFAGCSNLKYTNLESLIINDYMKYTSFVDNNLTNPIICINNEESLKKIISLYKCKSLYDSENWGEYEDKISNNDKNKYIEGCLLSKIESNCYQLCSYYFYYDEKQNKYLCTEQLECPEPYNKLIDGKNECIKSCSETKKYKYDILGYKCSKGCPEYFKKNKNNPYYCTLTNVNGNNQKSTIIEIMQSGIMKDILSHVLTNDRSRVLKDNEDSHIISTLNTNLNRTNFSSINFGECEQLIRNKSNINDNEELILYEIEHDVKGFNIPIIEYLLFQENGTYLDLSICNNMTIQYYIPIGINENEIDLYNPYSDIYNDECKKVKSDNGLDMTLYDRTKRFNDEDMSLCEKDCIYQGFDSDTKKVKCDCNLKNDMTYNNEETNPDDLLYKLDSSKSNSNMKVTKCINNVFNSPKNLVSNSGFLTLSLVLILFIIIFIIFCKKGTQLLEKKIDDVIYKKFYKKNKNVRIVDNNPKKANKNIKKVKTFKNKNTIPPKKNKLAFDSNINLKNRYNTSNKTKKNTKIINNSQNKTLFKENTETKKNNNKSVKVEDKPDKNNDYELNSLAYKEAIKYDKRKCCDYYLSQLKNKQLFLFTFCSFNDYNSGIIKKFIFFLSFALHYAISALFFNDDMMHQIYLDEGKYNISYQLPNILISAASSTVILRIMLEIFILTERNVLQVKHQSTKNQAEKMKLQALKCIKIKFAFFFLINFILLSLFWFYLTCLNGTYENTQLYLIESTLIAFAFSFGYPFIWNIFPSALRICSLSGRNPNKGCLFYFSKFLQLI